MMLREITKLKHAKGNFVIVYKCLEYVNWKAYSSGFIPNGGAVKNNSYNVFMPTAQVPTAALMDNLWHS